MAAGSSGVLTGADGRFEIIDVPEGAARLYAHKPGLLGSPQGSLIIVTSGKNDFQIALAPAAKVSGVITDRDGQPVQKVGVSGATYANGELEVRKELR